MSVCVCCAPRLSLSLSLCALSRSRSGFVYTFYATTCMQTVNGFRQLSWLFCELRRGFYLFLFRCYCWLRERRTSENKNLIEETPEKRRSSEKTNTVRTLFTHGPERRFNREFALARKNPKTNRAADIKRRKWFLCECTEIVVVVKIRQSNYVFALVFTLYSCRFRWKTSWWSSHSSTDPPESFLLCQVRRRRREKNSIAKCCVVFCENIQILEWNLDVSNAK